MSEQTASSQVCGVRRQLFSPAALIRLDLHIDIRYIAGMIRSIKGKTTRDIYDGINSRQARGVAREIHDKATRLLDQIDAAPGLDFLRVPPSNRLEKLRGDLAGYWSLRINDNAE